ncbi:MAG: PDGLE domain-containing protein, partial [Muribaculaceae bacterium]|nr:PDGLE domain-containing protein [Muribaculaceae bacterium]
ATGAIISFVVKSRPDLLATAVSDSAEPRGSLKKVLIGFGVAALLIGGVLAIFASAYPDGLEWSIQQLTGSTELPAHPDKVAGVLQHVQSATSVMPDYDSSFSGIIGAVMVVILVWSVTSLLTAGRRHKTVRQ